MMIILVLLFVVLFGGVFLFVVDGKDFMGMVILFEFLFIFCGF